MICPLCKKNKTSIISSKLEKFTNLVKRKRYCICGNNFSTYEKFEKLRKKRKPRDDTLLKNKRIIRYANRRIIASLNVAKKAYKKLFNLTDNVLSKTSEEKIKKLLKESFVYSKGGKSYLLVTTKSKKQFSYEIESKKQSVRIIVNDPMYWADRWYIFGNPEDVPASWVEKFDKIQKNPNPFKKDPNIKENWLDRDLKRREVDEFYKSVCTYIKDEQYNQDFFIQNCDEIEEYWKNPLAWQIFLELR